VCSCTSIIMIFVVHHLVHIVLVYPERSGDVESVATRVHEFVELYKVLNFGACAPGNDGRREELRDALYGGPHGVGEDGFVRVVDDGSQGAVVVEEDHQPLVPDFFAKFVEPLE